VNIGPGPVDTYPITFYYLTPIGAQVGESALKAGAPLTHNLDYFTPHIQNFKTFHCPRLFF